MNLQFNLSLAEQYHSGTQRARILTESWVSENMYCPYCGHEKIGHFPNNRAVADFYCPVCKNEFELKSKNGKLGSKIPDGAYDTMIKRICAENNPNFLFMCYSKEKSEVNDLIFISRHFFWPGIIERRKPLSKNARRAGWTGCNILLNDIPTQGRIPIISQGIVKSKESVIQAVQTGSRLYVQNVNSRGWIFDVLECVNQIPSETFTLNDMYKFEENLLRKHPSNNNIKPKIRQQLQLLRDKGVISFEGDGVYRKAK